MAFMSDLTMIHTDDAPRAIGPYSQAVAVDGWIFCSGQVALDPRTNELIDGDVTAQTHRVMANLKAVLAEGGASLQDVVKTTVFPVRHGPFRRHEHRLCGALR